MKTLIAALFLSTLTSCMVCKANRVFPKLAFFLSQDAQMERMARLHHKAIKGHGANQ